MESEPIPSLPRQTHTPAPVHPEEGKIANTFFALHYPAFQRTFSLHGHGVKVRVCGVLLMIAALIAGIIAGDKKRGSDANFLIFLNTLMGMIPGYLAYAFGAYLSACAEHHRSTLINSILNNPHLSPGEAQGVITRLENRIRNERF